jgi:hypothetical protein
MDVFTPCHRIACAKSAPQVIGCCLTTLFAPTAVGDTEGGIRAILLALSRLNHLKDLQAYTSFSGTGETVTVENRDVFVEATWTYSQQLPCLTASSPSLVRARKHVAMQLSPSHRIACAKGAPQVISYTVAGSSASTRWDYDCRKKGRMQTPSQFCYKNKPNQGFVAFVKT